MDIHASSNDGQAWFRYRRRPARPPGRTCVARGACFSGATDELLCLPLEYQSRRPAQGLPRFAEATVVSS